MRNVTVIVPRPVQPFLRSHNAHGVVPVRARMEEVTPIAECTVKLSTLLPRPSLLSCRSHVPYLPLSLLVLLLLPTPAGATGKEGQRHGSHGWESSSSPDFWPNVILSVLMIIFAGLMSGLTIGK